LVILHNSMARFNQTRKRSRSVGPRRGAFKKRRVVRRARTGRSTTFTSTQGTSRSLGFSRKRTSRSQFRRILWNGSVAQKHFRSNFAFPEGITTPATSNTCTTYLRDARFFAGNLFWTAAGGGINPDGGAMPTFDSTGDFVIRGGIMGITVSNAPDTTGTNDPFQVQIYLIKTTVNFSTASLPATVQLGWDPTLIPDFQTNIGRIIMRKKLILNDSASVTVERKMPIQKIDQSQYQSTFNAYAWLVIIGNTTSPVANDCIVTRYYNLSFVGDVV